MRLTTAAEETAKQNDTQANDKPSEEGEAGGEVDTNASKIISNLGEDKKVFAQQLIDLAKQSDANREVVKNLIKGRPDVEKYFKSKFGEEYDTYFKMQEQSGVNTETAGLDVAKIREEERAKARADVYFEEFEKKNAKAVEELQQPNNTPQKNMMRYHALLKILESEMEFGEDLLMKAGLLVNVEKTTAGKKMPAMPTKGNEAKAPDPDKKKTTVSADDPNLRKYANNIGRTPESILEGLSS